MNDFKATKERLTKLLGTNLSPQDEYYFELLINAYELYYDSIDKLRKAKEVKTITLFQKQQSQSYKQIMDQLKYFNLTKESKSEIEGMLE